LMHDFSCTDPGEMYYHVLADRVRFFKESKEGVEIMCRAMEDMRNQTLKEGMKEERKSVARRMLAAGQYDLEEIVHISGLSLEEVEQLNADRSA
ncbi:MAG: nuclease, partial [Ruminiclostridium sp.]|nr:nuclease [Ruminiclostridium sp.]